MNNRRTLDYFKHRREWSKSVSQFSVNPGFLICNCPLCGAKCFRYPEKLDLMEMVEVPAGPGATRIYHQEHVCKWE